MLPGPEQGDYHRRDLNKKGDGSMEEVHRRDADSS